MSCGDGMRTRMHKVVGDVAVVVPKGRAVYRAAKGVISDAATLYGRVYDG